MNTNGSRWWKFDLHTHTPFSTDTVWYPLIGTDDELKPSDWLKKYMDAEIDCVAITDHNGGGWIDRLRSEYEKLEQTKPSWFRPLYIFPGVEISVNGGFHILAIFPLHETTSRVDTLLGAVGFFGQKGDPLFRTEQTCSQVAQKIVEHGGLCIPAHVDIANGILLKDDNGRVSCDSQTIRQFLEYGQVSAIETRDKAWVPPGVYTDIGLNLPRILATDCHNFRGERKPGEYYTWIKMGTPSLEGLRLALLDGSPLSIRRSDEEPSDPNIEPELVIQSITLKKLRLMGRQQPVEAKFSPWLTALIGGRGTGKSTIIDGLRLAFSRVADLPGDLKKEFEEFDKVASNRRDRGAMLQDSEIFVNLKKSSGSFRLIWKYGQSNVRIESLQANGSWMPAEGMVRQRFPIRILSQKEIFAIAKVPQSLINLVDVSPDLKLNDWRERRDNLAAKYKRLVSEQRELITKTKVKGRLQGELQDTLAGISVFEQGENRQALLTFQRTQRQSQILKERSAEFLELAQELRNAALKVVPSPIDESDFDEAIPSDASALSLLRDSYREQTAMVSKLNELIEKVVAYDSHWNQLLSLANWTESSLATRASYEKLTEELAAAGFANPTAYASLIKKRQELDEQLDLISEAEQKAVSLQSEIDATITEISLHRCELSTRRSQFLARVLSNNSYVRVKVLAFGERPQQCEEEFRKAISRTDGRNESDILSEDGATGVLSKLYRDLPNDPTDRATELLKRIKQIKDSLITSATTGNPSGEYTQWLVKHLQKLSPEDLDKILLWFPEDTLEVDYRRDVNRNDWASIEQGSPGQQTAAILAFLLSHGNEPIILDQPEDDLDNHLIYDLIVSQIRQCKQRRQVITATHNPNIVVNADAEMVLAMTSASGQCLVNEVTSGCLQETAVREEVCKVMEGGRDAFRKRYQRIFQPPKLSQS